MKRKVKVSLFDSYEDGIDGIKQDVSIDGRLLGAVSTQEYVKIVNNPEVARRLLTSETVSLSDTLEGLKTLGACNVEKKSCGSILIAVSKVQIDSEFNAMPVLSRQLLLSAPIALITEVNKLYTNVVQASLTCDDDTTIVILEEKRDNE